MRAAVILTRQERNRSKENKYYDIETSQLHAKYFSWARYNSSLSSGRDSDNSFSPKKVNEYNDWKAAQQKKKS